ncbi:MAG: cation diffusion facilitator family transporter [Selenomonadaceae bacterium]|nr:cation diffusion facilitator family transporter [Selenomonadaceae bacterium]
MTDMLLYRCFGGRMPKGDNPDDRKKVGQFTGSVGIVVNFLLFALKLSLGLITESVAIIADAINNLSDAGVSLVTILGFRFAAKPADDEHPYGHGRIEYLTGLFLAAIIIVVGFKTAEESYHRIVSPVDINVDIVVIGGLAVSILAKLWLGYFYKTIGNRIDSVAIRAAATDSFSDCISTSGVLLSIIVFYCGGYNIDGYAGMVVALFILLTGYHAADDTLKPLLGTNPDEELTDRIDEIVKQNNDILGYHDLVIHSYGPNHSFATLHAEISADYDMVTAHDIVDALEKRINEELGVEVIIHMDPVDLDNTEEKICQRAVNEIIRNIDSRLSLHDFRLTESEGEQKKMCFEIMVPHGYKINDERLKGMIFEELLNRFSPYTASIHLDHPYQ